MLLKEIDDGERNKNELRATLREKDASIAEKVDYVFDSEIQQLFANTAVLLFLLDRMQETISRLKSFTI